MNTHQTKDVPQQTLLQHDDPWMTTESDVKPYILEPLDIIKSSSSQYIATSIINYGPYIDNILHLKILPMHSADNFPPPSLAHNPLIPRYDKHLHNRYSDILILNKANN